MTSIYCDSFSYQGQEYQFCVDGIGKSFRLMTPDVFIDQHKNKISKKYLRKNLITSGLLTSFVGLSFLSSGPILILMSSIIACVYIPKTLLKNKKRKRNEIDMTESNREFSGNL